MMSLGVLTGLLVLSFTATAGDLEPPGAPAPTMKTLDQVEPATPITSLPYTISASGSYYLTGDLSAPGTGIIINTDNVTLDLKGYSIIGTGSGYYQGISMTNRRNVEIRNGTIRNFGSRGIYSVGGKEHRIINLRIISNGHHGMQLPGDGHLVKNCTVASNAASGILVGGGCTLIGNTARDNRGSGIQVGAGCTVVSNTAYKNDMYGIYFTGGDCLVDQNTAYNNSLVGGYDNFSNCNNGTITSSNHAPTI